MADNPGERPQQQPVTTGAAMARRVRRRRLADAFERNERTFGDAEEPERLERFLAWGRSIGGEARRVAEEDRGIGLAMPWPVPFTHFAAEAWAQLTVFAQSQCTHVSLLPNTSAGYLSLRTWSQGTREEDAMAMMKVFWQLFKMTTDTIGYEASDQIVIPFGHAELFEQVPVELADLAFPLELAPRGRGRFNLQEARGLFALSMSRYTGSVDAPEGLNDVEVQTMLQAALDDLWGNGYMLLAHSEEEPGWPLGLANLGRRAGVGFGRQLSELGGPRYALASVVAKIEQQFENYKTQAVLYTCGYESLHKCFPRAGYRWLERGHPAARRYVPVALQERYSMQVGRFVDCMDLTSDTRRRPRGHLGFHPMNLGLMLGGRNNRRWRIQRYVELWLLLQSTIMTQGEGEAIHVVMMCRQGKHRSAAWMAIESMILQACGFRAWYENVCRWVQEKERCQYDNDPNGCEHCGNARKGEVPTPGDDIAQAAINEFFETVLLLESLV